jgi:hypothetical protein
VRHLIPEPYNQLSENGIVEDIYASCMDKATNVFDIKAFKHKCMERIEFDEESNEHFKDEKSRSLKKRGRKIRTGKTFWTVLRRVNKPLKHPYDPPKGFSDRLSQLKGDNKIKAFHMDSTDRPRWLANETKHKKNIIQMKNTKEASKFTDMSAIISDSETLENVEFVKAYQKPEMEKSGERERKSRPKPTSSKKEFSSISDVENDEYVNELSRMKKYGIAPPSLKPEKNKDGLNAVQCIQELSNLGALTRIKWGRTAPSHSSYASIDPELYEEVRLEVKGQGFSLMFSQDRNRNVSSRKLLKHHIASIALRQIFSDCDWVTMSTNELKSYLVLDNESPVNVDNRNALQCLHELKDTRIFEVLWEFSVDSSSSENVELIVKKTGTEEIMLSLKEVRNIYKSTKSDAKQKLAAIALQQILGNETDWKSMTLSAMKSCINA